MACEHCEGADRLFDLKGAKKELKVYKKRGALKATRHLIELLEEESFKDKSLLDIGGGIGILQWNHLENNGRDTTGVDASSGYLNIAEEVANEKGLSDKTRFLFGDFLDVHADIPEHDFVTMDKVICCYPDYKTLIKTASSKSKELLAVSFPMDGIIAEFAQWLGIMFMKYIKNNPFRPYVHPVREIERVISESGFDLISQSRSFPWHIRVYKRNN
ncbi:MAG: hypothetical protein CL840_18570 [Crocinitomicaceae bacterium]|nr:hypothetical protein [Crocinitomicaceae bacterium]|tara:strand:+ start:523 stop:1170 length:648 start_codon:yes stop_codon:yes gene_type:complete